MEINQENLEGLTLEQLNATYQQLSDIAAKTVMIESIISLAQQLEITQLAE